MVVRQIIKINEELCDGCGLCAKACHEGAIGIVDGKAKLLRDDFCDGLGDCLPACPRNAIKFEQREALEYDEEAVLAAQAAKITIEEKIAAAFKGSGCAGSAVKEIKQEEACDCSSGSCSGGCSGAVKNQLRNWPVQIKLVPPTAPYFDGADLLIAADCTAYAYGNFHNDFMKGKVTIIGCPKLDAVDYAEKLTEIIKVNDIRSITLTRMHVPCCGGMQNAVLRAVEASGKDVPVNIVTISADGSIL